VDAAGSVGTSELSAAGGQVGLQAIPVPHQGVNLGLGTIDSQRKLCRSLLQAVNWFWSSPRSLLQATARSCKPVKAKQEYTSRPGQ